MLHRALIIIVGGVLLLGCQAAPALVRTGPERLVGLEGTKRWAILLDPPRPIDLQHPAYADLDLLIVEPDRIQSGRVPAQRVGRPGAREAGGRPEHRPLLLAYISLGEAEAYRPYFAAIAQRPWVLAENPNWPGNHPVDPRQEEWREVILEQEAPRILNGGFDGLFLDTLDVAGELERLGRKGARAAMLALVAELRRRFPDALLVSNNGLELLPELAEQVDGFVVEDLHYGHDFAAGRSLPTPLAERERRLALLEPHRARPVFAIDYTDDPAQAARARRLARREELLSYVTGVRLDRLSPEPAAWAAGPEPRHVLLLYDEGDGPQDDGTLRRFAAVEMVLNHLGCVVRRHDLSQGRLPAAEHLEDLRGIVTCLRDEELAGPEAYLDWLTARAREGLRIVILGELGATRDVGSGREVPAGRLAEAWRALGLETGADWPERPAAPRVRVDRLEPAWLEFERSLAAELTPAQDLWPADPRARVLLSLGRSDAPGARTAAVVLTPQGGMAQTGYELHYEPRVFRFQWRLDPFRFLSAALALDGLPRPDTTTRNGRRLWFSHIDGDGMVNVSFRGKQYCGQVILDEIIKAYRLPFTCSVVTAQVDPRALGSPQAYALARDIFAQPNVEAASHGYAHPQDWETHELTIKDVPGYRYSEEAEIGGSIDYINRELLPAGRRVELFLWTGACNPTASALRLARQAGVLNLNGSDPRLDPEFPSYAYVAPLARQVGDERQIHAAASNENIYTHGFADPLFGFENVLYSFRNTETPVDLWTQGAPPRRVRPINVYFHFYSAAERAALEALKRVLDGTREGPIAPVFASEYARQVEGFFAARIVRLGPDRWGIRDYGACRTLRLDEPYRGIDLAASKGCLGYARGPGGCLYVHLAAGPEAEIALSDDDDGGDLPPTSPPRPYLAEAAPRIDGWRAQAEASVETSTGGAAPPRFSGGASEACDRRSDPAPRRGTGPWLTVDFEAAGLGLGEVVIAGVPPRSRWRLQGAAAGSLTIERVTADEQGRLNLRVLSGAYRLVAGDLP